MRTKPNTRLLVASVLGMMLLAGVCSILHSPIRATGPTLSADSDLVVINEVAWMGTAASTYDEWIELYNPTDHPIPITGWTLSDGGDISISLSGVISASGYFLLERTDDTTVSDIPADQIYTGNLSNSGEVLTLTNEAGQVVDTANADGGEWPAGDSGTGVTMERVDPTAPDSDANWAANDSVTRNGLDADGNPINGTPRAQNSRYALPGLCLTKGGPPFVTAGLTFTCWLSVTNTGDLPLTRVTVTDTLPTGLTFITQTSPFSFSQPAPNILSWQVGDLLSGMRHLITLTLQADRWLSDTVSNVATATEGTGHTATALWTVPVRPYVRLYALEPVNTAGSGEAAALINLGPYTVPLHGWRLNDDPGGGGASFPLTATIVPGQILWLAQTADGFSYVWGFDADWAAQAITRPVPLLNGPWPGFTDDGEVAYLFDANGQAIDVLAYGKGTPTMGWNGPAVPYPYPGYRTGQVLYRKLDPDIASPGPDTDTAGDWAQEPHDPIYGRRLRYPGWDLETFFFPAVVTPTTTVTVAVAPDGALDLVSRTLASAQESILIEGYTFESVALHRVISDRLQAGVVVTMLLEGEPVGWTDEARKTEFWIVRSIHGHPHGTVYFMHGDAARYRYQHAKFITVDGRVALVSTENLNPRGMPSDRKDNGTLGHRGFVLAVESPGVAGHLEEILAHDLDPGHHADLVPWGVAPFTLDDPTFVPLPEPDWTTYTAVFTAAVVATATDFTVVQAPENNLRDRDGLLGLLGRAGAGDAIAAMQLSEPFTWTAEIGPAGLNPRLQALIAAARRGAEVRLLLDEYYDADGRNAEACRLVNGVAAQEGIGIACRLGNRTGLGIHAKIFLVRLGDERWVHLGSINGTESANKVNREVALQFRSAGIYDRTLNVFESDWAQAHGPFIYQLRLPLVMRDFVPPADYPLISEVLINPSGTDDGKEWIELYNPGLPRSIAGWTLGDAISPGDYGDGRYAFPAGAQLAHGQVVVVAACGTDFSAAYGFNPDYEWGHCSPAVPDLIPVGSWDGFGLALGNAADEAILLDAGGRRVDSAAWGGTARVGVLPYPLDPGDTFPSGASLKRYPPDADRDDCSRDFYISGNPSPGRVTQSG